MCYNTSQKEVNFVEPNIFIKKIRYGNEKIKIIYDNNMMEEVEFTKENLELIKEVVSNSKKDIDYANNEQYNLVKRKEKGMEFYFPLAAKSVGVSAVLYLITRELQYEWLKILTYVVTSPIYILSLIMLKQALENLIRYMIESEMAKEQFSYHAKYLTLANELLDNVNLRINNFEDNPVRERIEREN